MTTIRRLGTEHLPAIIGLHHKVLALLPTKNLAACETDGFFADHIATCGHIYGAFRDDTLMAYSVLGLPRRDDPNFGVDHNLLPGQLAGVAHIDGVSVAPEWRGQGWQRKMINHRLAAALAAGRFIALSTVAPGNVPSLRSLLSCGLTIRGMVEKFGGIRYLVRRDLAVDFAAVPVTGNGTGERPQSDMQWINLDDLPRQRTAIAGRCIGVGWRVDGGKIQIGYVPE